MKKYIKGSEYEYKDLPDYGLSKLKGNERQILNTIFDNVCHNYCEYGYWRKPLNPVLGDKVWSSVLWLSDWGSIGWQHYGSSANKATKKDLLWILMVIFKMKPSEFVNEYICRDFYEDGEI